jgi:ParB family chromosome partitioning protein
MDSVRQTEVLVKKYLSEQGVAKKKMKVSLSAHVTDFKNGLSKKLNTKISVVKDVSGKGKISIPFTSEEELERIINILK